MSERKRFILKKSKELFFSKGYENVSIRDICKAIEYGRSAIYNIFSSKEEIYGYVYVEAMTIFADLINEVNIENSDYKYPLKPFTQKIFEFYNKHRQYYLALFFFDINHVACSKMPSYLLEKKYEQKERAMTPVRAVFKKGIKNQYIRNIDIDYIIETYFASLLGIINYFISENTENNENTLKKVMIDHAEIYEAGLKK